MAITKEQIISLLMKRDDMDREEAKELVNEVQYQIADALDMGLGYDAIEEILMDFLGLEMDYIYPFI